VTTVLQGILARTREHVLDRKRRFPLERLQMTAFTPTGRRGFGAALARPGQVNVIAEFKRRSPSRGAIRADADPTRIAQAYEIGGAAALSVLTDEPFFGGSIADLREARLATLLPTLRKDFIVDPYQVGESVLTGADAILLIVAALDDRALRSLHAAALEAGLEALVEVHDRGELDRALDAGARIVGVNSRDLRTMTVDLETAVSLAPAIPDGVVAVAESGIRGPADVVRLRDVGYDAFLIGEHLMAQDDPTAALEALIRGASEPRGASAAARGSRVAVKICGITTVEDGLLAAHAGADAIGLVLWPDSPRAVDVRSARAIADALPPLVHRVGVFVNPTRAEVERAVVEIGLDVVQLHGDETPQLCRDLKVRVLKAVRVGPGFDAAEALRFENAAGGILLDTRADAKDALPGGTGRAFDWSLARKVRAGARYLVLAGGLTPENVERAVAAVEPDAVDVSSGVESSPGRKDPARVRAFVRAVRAASR
jgi:indole-3-glycerol phosphate synthase/phosphoribosylanthranilate isomerase/anthranilate synthase/indole-3-glycerol phosphate synthase/phosphoribosylanthranilate isomerase